MGYKVSLALLSICLLIGCVAEEPPAGKEIPAETPKPEKKKEKVPTAGEALGLTEKEAEAIEMVISSGPYDYKLKDVATIEKRGEDDEVVNYTVELKSGEPLLLSIKKELME